MQTTIIISKGEINYYGIMRRLKLIVRLHIFSAYLVVSYFSLKKFTFSQNLKYFAGVGKVR